MVVRKKKKASIRRVYRMTQARRTALKSKANKTAKEKRRLRRLNRTSRRQAKTVKSRVKKPFCRAGPKGVWCVGGSDDKVKGKKLKTRRNNQKRAVRAMNKYNPATKRYPSGAPYGAHVKRARAVQRKRGRKITPAMLRAQKSKNTMRTVKRMNRRTRAILRRNRTTLNRLRPKKRRLRLRFKKKKK